MKTSKTRCRAPGLKLVGQRGVALVAVLWVVAALSILVTGLVQTQREEIRSAGSARIRLQADVVGRGAIHVAVQTLIQQSQRRERLARISVAYDGVYIVVEVQPFSGLVDVNLAPMPLLAALFSVGGSLEAGVAARLAAAVVALRDARQAGPPPRFRSPEELLAVEGVDYDLYAKLVHLVTTDSRGSGRINPLAAPLGVLLVLADGDQTLAGRVAAERDAEVVGMDTTQLQTAFVDQSVSSRLRFRAFVPALDGSEVIVVRDIDLSFASEGTAPWRTMRVHAPVMSLKQGGSS